MIKRIEIANRYNAFQGRQINAQYDPDQLNIYQGNPLIECLPPLLETEQMVGVLAKYPDFDESHRNLPTASRLLLLRQAKRFYQPVQQSIELGLALNTMIRDSYQYRNPLDFHQCAERRQQIGAIDWFDIDDYDDDGSQTDGIIIVGLSGVGKTRSLRRNLAYIPQVITHRSYQGQKLILQQIGWLAIDCPAKGTIWGLCSAFFAAIDRILGTNYLKLYVKDRTKAEVLIKSMATIADIHCLGILVIDEVQNLEGAREGRVLLNFLVQLSNELKIPIVLVGTFKAEKVLTHAFRIARRGSGYVSPIWRALSNNETEDVINDWSIFLKALWRFQYVQHPIKLNKALSNTLYDVSVGIIDLAIKIFISAQGRAILTGTEKLTSGLFRSVAHDEFPWTSAAVNAMKVGTKTALLKYEDLYHSHMELDAIKATMLPVPSGQSKANTQKDLPPEPLEETPLFIFQGKSLLEIGTESEMSNYEAMQQKGLIYSLKELLS